MKKLIEHIEYLVLNHDCVTIPGVGAFIAQYHNAKVDSELGCFFPPRRIISFNSAIRHNDGLLATSIARKESISYSRAVDRMNEYVGILQQELNESRIVALGNVGTLSLIEDDKLLFEPSAGFSASKQLVGMQAFPLTKISLDNKDYKADDVYYVPISRNLFKLAASIIMILMLGFVLSTPIIDEKAVFASMGTNITSPVNDNIIDMDAMSPDQQLSIALPDSRTSMATYEAPAPEITVAETPVKKAHRYYLVIASLPNQQKAEQYLARHKDEQLSMQIISSPTRCRIYVAAGDSYQEAAEMLSSKEFTGKHPDAWVYKK